MSDQLSGVAIIICIAFGVLTFLLLFIFANRQIKRFSLKSRSGPHVATAHDSQRAMQQEIERRLDAVKFISYQPVLLKKEDEPLFKLPQVSPCHLYRMKALDSLYTLEATVVGLDPVIARLFSKDLRLCLMRLFYKGVLHLVKAGLINRFASMYEFARHEPGQFTFESFEQFMNFLNLVQQSISQSHGSSQPTLEEPSGEIVSSTPETDRNLLNGKVANGSLPETPLEEKNSTYETSV